MAARWLRRRGYSILARQVRIHGVEIDLVARYRGRLTLVEVRGRTSRTHAPHAWLSESKRRRLFLAAEGRFRGMAIERICFVEVVGPVPLLLRACPWALALWPESVWRCEARNLGD